MCADQTSGHVCSQWSLLWWLLKGEPISWFSRHSVVIRFKETPSPAQNCFLSHCILVWKGIWSLFCNCYCVHTHTHTQCIFRPNTHTPPCIFIHPDGISSVCVCVCPCWCSFHFPVTLGWRATFLMAVFANRRPGIWGRVCKEGRGKEKESFKLKGSFPKRKLGWMTAETLPSSLGRWAWNAACITLCSVSVHIHTNTPIHPSIYTWFGMSRSIVLRESLFLFFLSILLNCCQLSNKQAEKLFWKTLHTPFLSSALKYRLNTHILPVFSYSDSILTCHLILASYFSHVYLPVTCICYLNRKKTFKKKKEKLTVALHYTIILLLLLWHFGILWSFISCIYFIRKYYALKIRK